MDAPLKIPELQDWIGQQVVLDAVSPYVYIGTLVGTSETFVQLADADIHDLRDSATTREIYIVEASRYGVRRNRKRIHIRWDQIASIARLTDVVED